MATLESRIAALEQRHLPQTPLEELLSQEMMGDDGQPLEEWEKVVLINEALDAVFIKGGKHGNA